MNRTLEQFFDPSRRYLFAARLDDVGDRDRGQAVAKAAREMAAEQVLAAARKPPSQTRRTA